MMDDDWQHNGHRRFVRYSTIEWKRDNKSYRVPASDAFCRQNIEKENFLADTQFYTRVCCARYQVSNCVVSISIARGHSIQICNCAPHSLESKHISLATRPESAKWRKRKKYAAENDSNLWAAIDLSFYVFSLTNWSNRLQKRRHLCGCCWSARLFFSQFDLIHVLFCTRWPIVHVRYVLQWILLLSFRRTEPRDCGAA